MTDETEDKVMRIIFRPTFELQEKIKNILGSGRFKTQSELIRSLIWKGIEILEREENDILPNKST